MERNKLYPFSLTASYKKYVSKEKKNVNSLVLEQLQKATIISRGLSDDEILLYDSAFYYAPQAYSTEEGTSRYFSTDDYNSGREVYILAEACNTEFLKFDPTKCIMILDESNPLSNLKEKKIRNLTSSQWLGTEVFVDGERSNIDNIGKQLIALDYTEEIRHDYSVWRDLFEAVFIKFRFSVLTVLSVSLYVLFLVTSYQVNYSGIKKIMIQKLIGNSFWESFINARGKYCAIIVCCVCLSSVVLSKSLCNLDFLINLYFIMAVNLIHIVITMGIELITYYMNYIKN